MVIRNLVTKGEGKFMDEEKRKIKEVDTENNQDSNYYGSLLPSVYNKSNTLISAKYKSTLFENKLLALALSTLRTDSKTGEISSTIKAGHIRKVLNANTGSFYNQLAKAAKNMTGKKVGYNNPEVQKFEYMAVVIYAKYDNGYFTIEFNPKMKEYLVEIKGNYTRLSLPVMMSFNSVYSFRLYEFLRSRAYTPKNLQHIGEKSRFTVTATLAELKMMLGVVNAAEDKVQEILDASENPDYDMAVRVASEKMFEKNHEFKKQVVDVAVSEINEKSDIEVAYEIMRATRNEISGFLFDIRFKKKEAIALTDEEKDEIYEKISDLIDEPLKIRDVKAIADAAEYDYELVRKTYEGITEAYGDCSSIDNFTGFIISAIKDGYYEKPVKKNGKKAKPGKKENPFNRFEQNEYDFETLEKELAGNL